MHVIRASEIKILPGGHDRYTVYCLNTINDTAVFY